MRKIILEKYLSLEDIRSLADEWETIQKSNDNNDIKRQKYDALYDRVTNLYFFDTQPTTAVTPAFDKVKKAMRPLYLDYGFKMMDGNNKIMELCRQLIQQSQYRLGADVIEFFFNNNDDDNGDALKLWGMATKTKTICCLLNSQLYTLQRENSNEVIENEIKARELMEVRKTQKKRYLTFVCEVVYDVTPPVRINQIKSNFKLNNPDDAKVSRLLGTTEEEGKTHGGSSRERVQISKRNPQELYDTLKKAGIDLANKDDINLLKQTLDFMGKKMQPRGGDK